MTVDEVTNTGKNAVNVWSGFTYEVPRPYLRPRVIPKDQEGQKRHFVPGPGDGPEYKFAIGEKGKSHVAVPYGKDAKMPPVSYLPLPSWGAKKEGKKETKDEKGSKTERGSFIDAIFSYGNKYKFPGPSQYFATSKNDLEKKQKKPKEKEKTERMNFLMDYQYLGMNIPGPGEYPLRDSWAEIANKKKTTKTEDSKKQVSASQDWKVKNDKKNGPGQYDIVRLLTVTETKESGGKQIKKFKSIPVFERAKFGIINKGGNISGKKTSASPSASASPGSYFKKEGDIEKAYMKTYRPMRRY